MKKNGLLFLSSTVVLSVLVLPPLFSFVRSARPTDYYSFIPLIFLVTGYLLFAERRKLFAGGMEAHPFGIALMVLGALGLGIGLSLGVDRSIGIFVYTIAGLASWIGAYLVLFAKTEAKPRLFPLLFLFFVVPIPASILNRVVRILVLGSTYFAQILFRSLLVPFIPDGAMIYLPGFSIEVAQECSGIRSSLALLITTVLAGYLFLEKRWAKALLALFVVPVAMLKNAVRIVTLCLLAGYFDMKFIKGGFLHRSGGFVFFGIGLLLMGLILFFLKGMQHRRKGLDKESHADENISR
jgi:exosortase